MWKHFHEVGMVNIASAVYMLDLFVPENFQEKGAEAKVPSTVMMEGRQECQWRAGYAQ